jgi:hypothetical protein
VVELLQVGGHVRTSTPRQAEHHDRDRQDGSDRPGDSGDGIESAGKVNGRRCFAAFRPRTPHSARRLKRKCPNADEKTAQVASDTDSSALARNAHLSDALVGRRC